MAACLPTRGEGGDAGRPGARSRAHCSQPCALAACSPGVTRHPFARPLACSDRAAGPAAIVALLLLHHSLMVPLAYHAIQGHTVRIRGACTGLQAQLCS
jgi:hypothetical protein